MNSVQLELSRCDTQTIDALKAIEGSSTVFATPDHFEGGVEIVTAVLSLAATAIPVIASIIKDHIHSKRYIKVKLKGIEIQGADLDDVEKFLRSIAGDE